LTSISSDKCAILRITCDPADVTLQLYLSPYTTETVIINVTVGAKYHEAEIAEVCLLDVAHFPSI